MLLLQVALAVASAPRHAGHDAKPRVGDRVLLLGSLACAGIGKNNMSRFTASTHILYAFSDWSRPVHYLASSLVLAWVRFNPFVYVYTYLYIYVYIHIYVHIHI